jgi:hypothetical protein
MNKPRVCTTKGVVAEDLWQCVEETETVLAFRYLGTEPIIPTEVCSPAGQLMPVLAGTYFAPGVVLRFPRGLQIGDFKIKAQGNVIRNGKVVTA